MLGHRNSNVTRAVYLHEIRDAERVAERRARLDDGRPGTHLADLAPRAPCGRWAVLGSNQRPPACKDWAASNPLLRFGPVWHSLAETGGRAPDPIAPCRHLPLPNGFRIIDFASHGPILLRAPRARLEPASQRLGASCGAPARPLSHRGVVASRCRFDRMTTSPERRRFEALPVGAQPIRIPAKHDSLNVHQDLDVREAVELLAERIPILREIRLFGSRRFRTGSSRSDVDLLVIGEHLPSASCVAAIARDIDSYLDVFLARGGVAQSAVNESVISQPDLESLVGALDAVVVWQTGEGWVADQSLSTARVLAGFNPPYTTAAAAGPDPLVARVDVLFVSALAKEYDAIVSKFDREITTPRASTANYARGEIDAAHGERRVAACVADRPGTLPAALTALRGVQMFRPNLVVLVGITAGVAGELDVGDLIIPDTVVEYEATKIGTDGEVSHGRQHAIDPLSVAAVLAWRGLESWLGHISTSRPDGGSSRLSTDAMASGNKVVASAERAALIASSSRKAAAIEMESLGVVEACQRADPLVPALVVKAVSDLADEKKDDSWHAFATNAAAELASVLVRENVV